MTAVGQDSNHHEAPVDKWKLVRIVFFLHGISALMPWNMLINADSYFVDFKLNPSGSLNHSALNQPIIECNKTFVSANCSSGMANNLTVELNTDETLLQNYRQNFLPYLSTASKLPNIIFQLVNLLFSSSYKSYSRRLNVTFVIQIGLFILTIAMALIDTNSWPEVFFWVTMVTAVLFNIANGIFQSSLYGIVAKFPMIYINFVTLGFSFSGTIASIFLIISLLLSPHPQIVALYYFTFATAFMIMCFINELIISKNRFYQYYATLIEDTKSQRSEQHNYDQETSVTEQNIFSVRTKEADSNEAQVTIKSYKRDSAPFNRDVYINGSVQTFDYDESFHQEPKEVKKSGMQEYILVIKQSRIQLLNTIIIYLVTFSIFPTIQAGIKPVSSIVEEKFFAPIFCFLFFNTFATLGNYVAEKTLWPKPQNVIYWTFLRLIFIPIFLFCNYLPDHRKWPVLVNSDLLYSLASASLAFTNGHLSSLAMMYAPKCVSAELSSKAAMIASAAIIVGILIGVQCSIVLNYFVTEFRI